MFAVVWRPQDTGFSLTAEAPKAFHRAASFVKDGGRFVTRANVDTCVHFGLLRAAMAGPAADADTAVAANGGGAAAGRDAGGAAAGPGAGRAALPAGPQAALLQLLSGVFLPQLSAPDGRWPESARREFLSTTHRFLASLTEAVHAAGGRTVLYIPAGDGLAGRPPGEAARDRALTQRLETTVIHWTRQVRGALRKAEQLDAAAGGPLGGDGGGGGGPGNGGPLAEIAFWRQRADDLGGLDAQLASREVRDVAAVLVACGSGYLADFEAQRGAIAREAEAARDNVKFLSCLEAPCAELAAAAPAQVPALLPRVLSCVRIVWSLSGHYNTPARLVGLLRRIAAEVVARCAAAVRACSPLVARGEAGVRAAVAALAECIAACEAVRGCYDRTAAAVSRALPAARSWDDIDVTPVFPVVEAFLQRCRDLSEVCEAQLQFVPVAAPPSAAAGADQAAGAAEGAPDRDAGGGGSAAAAPESAAAAVGRGLVLPVFGGARGAEMEKSVGAIAASFQGLLAGLRRLDYDILDAKGLRWAQRLWFFGGVVMA
jgi:dynein heavy chain